MRPINDDTLNRAMQALELLKIYKVTADRGIELKRYDLELDEDEMVQTMYEIIDENPQMFSELVDWDMIPNSDILNKFYPDLYEACVSNEISVYALLIKDKEIKKYHDLYMNLGVDLQDTDFEKYIYDAQTSIDPSQDDYSYFEIFVPKEEVIQETGAYVILFYTDPTLLNSYVLEEYYNAIDHVRAVLNGKEKICVKNKAKLNRFMHLKSTSSSKNGRRR